MRNLNILQSGGGVFYSSIANPYSNAAVADLQAATSSKSSDKDDGLIPKALMKTLNGKGIPVDVDKFADMLADFEQQSNFGLGVNKRQLYKLLAYANRIIKQSEDLEAAEKRAEENGALDEFAVDARGNLFVPDEKGNIKRVHASEFDASKLQALTVGELLHQRKFNPNEVDDSTIATTVGNNIGIEKINDYIQGILKAVGSAEDASEAYVNLGSILGKQSARKPSDMQMEALRDLYLLSQLIGPDAIFKVKDSYKSRNMDAAMSYIISMLPNNMKTQLIARNVAAGGEYQNSNQFAADIIRNAAMAAQDTKISKGIDYDASINKAAGSEKSPELNRNLTNLELLIMGSLGKTEYNLIGSKNPNWNVTLYGTGTGWLSDANNNKIGVVPISLALEAGLGGVIDYNHIYAGNQKINQAVLDSILYNGREAVNVWVPTDGNGNINWTLLTLYEQMLERFSEDHRLTDEDKRQLLAQIGINGTVDDMGNFIGNDPRMERFIVSTGITSDQIIDPDENVFADVLNKNDKKYWFNVIHRVYANINKGIKGKDNKILFDTDWTEWGTDLIATPIFMRVGKTAKFDVGTLSNHGPLVRTQTYDLQLAKDQAAVIHKPSTALMFNE